MLEDRQRYGEGVAALHELFQALQLLDTRRQKLLAEASRQPGTRWYMLSLIEHQGATVSQLARSLHLSRQGVQHSADALVEEGLAEFVHNPHHKRAKLLSPTSAGRAALHDIQCRYLGWIQTLSAGLDPEGLRAAARTLTHLHERMVQQGDIGGAPAGDAAGH